MSQVGRRGNRKWLSMGVGFVLRLKKMFSKKITVMSGQPCGCTKNHQTVEGWVLSYVNNITVKIFLWLSQAFGGLGQKKKNQWANKCLVCKIYESLLWFWSFHILFYLLLPPCSKWLTLQFGASQPWLSILELPWERSEDVMPWPDPRPIKGVSGSRLPEPQHPILLKTPRWFAKCCQDWEI